MNEQEQIKNEYRTEVYTALLNGETNKANELLDSLKKDLSNSYNKIVVYQ